MSKGDDIVEKMKEQLEKHKRENDKFYDDFFNDENVPNELKEELKKLRERIQEENEILKKEFNEFMKKNKGRKILRYDVETFMPIFEEIE